MPGFTTHYLFGVDTYHELKDKQLKQVLRRQRQAFCLGLQGPDIFFYDIPYFVLYQKSLGAIARDASGNCTLHFQLRKETAKLNPEAWLAR